MTLPLAGRAVLVPRDPERASGLAARLEALGATVLVAPATRTEPAADPAALDAAVRRLAAGDHAWAVLTSVNAVRALEGAAARVAPGDPAALLAAAPTAWAAVGPTTRRALEALGATVSVVPAHERSAEGLVAVFPDPPAPSATGSARRVLLPQGDLARTTLRDGLAARGWEPDVVVAYRTLPVDLPADVVRRAGAGEVDAVVLTSGSVARQVAAQLGTTLPAVCIGRPSAEVAADLGLDVAAIATAPTDAALADAVVRALAVPAIVSPSEPAAGARPDTTEEDPL
ncbi:uroporphyrinogen-III synthase [Puerhibacterium sp. TATVAM-FAB25]|uniref:uroporphyrinogen-III synthase n=1 Tax=Puerhibacterium sp. TATVAM-FAB25 TaxID=3093699 RepID=UPI00397E36B0